VSEYERWQARFSGPDYAFGKEPNYFLKSCAQLLPRSGRAIADGEGRNGIWLAEQGLRRYQSADAGRPFGLVVDDKEAARRTLQSAGVAPIDGHFLDFRDPWGNRIEIVGYDNIQFSKAPNVLRGMGLTHLTKNESAKKELAKKGMALEWD
jgi:hypothetical protein